MAAGIARKAKMPYYLAMSTYLIVSSKGQVTLKKSVLAHLGVQPGQKLAVDLHPGGGVGLRPAPTGKISDAFGLLKRPGQKAVRIEEINDVIERAWAGER
jgi:bifunctional DNA-binding transcriptional regulator/antitoxin component of YhaV-PrlF toxin-antitoxin module